MSRIYYPQARAILQIVFDGFGPSARDTPPKIIPVLPKTVTVHRNAYRQADSWELVFDGQDLPVDPQLIRSGAAEIFLFETLGLSDASHQVTRQSGLQRTDRTSVEGIQEELGLSDKDRFTFDNRPMIAGLFDEHSIEMSSGGKWVSIQGQDYTLFLKSRQYPPDATGKARRIPSGKRLDKILCNLLALADTQGKLTLVTRDIALVDLPIVGANETRGNKRGIPVEQGTSYWDVMYNLAIRHGCILYVDGLNVVLARVQNARDRISTAKHIAWGKNLDSLNMSRKLGKEKVPRQVVKGYNPKTRQKITVEWPKNRQATPGTLGVEEDEFAITAVTGNYSKEDLLELAKGKFNLIGQSERSVRFSTRDLKDLKEKDMLDLKAGDTVFLGFEDFNQELINNDKVPEEAKFQHLTSRGYGDAIARIIAQNYTKLKLLNRPMYVKEISYNYDASGGINIEGELIDFVVVDGMREPKNKISTKSKNANKLRKLEKVCKG